MKAKTSQNGVTNFARPCTIAASSVTTASAWTGIRCGIVFDATTIPIAQAVSTIPIPMFFTRRTSWTYAKSPGIDADMKTSVKAPTVIAIARPRSWKSSAIPSRARSVAPARALGAAPNGQRGECCADDHEGRGVGEQRGARPGRGCE